MLSKSFAPSFGSGSPDSFKSLEVTGKQPARLLYEAQIEQIEDSSLASEDTPDCGSVSSDCSSLPTTSSFPPAVGVTTVSDGPPSHALLPPGYMGGDNPATTVARPNDENAPQALSTSASHEEEDLYSIAGLPILEERIPPDDLPDDLIVHDAHDLPYPVRYVRVTPTASTSRQLAAPVRDLAESDPPRRVAQLHLANENRVGNGAHSTVFRAPLTLPLEAGSEVATRVRVVAKTPAPDCGSHRQLHREARMYHAFPKELSEQSTQLRVATASESSRQRDVHRPPRPAAPSPGSGSDPPKRKASWHEQLKSKLKPKSRKSSSSSKSASKPLLDECPEVPLRPLKSVEVPPVVPKFFGYYLLLKPDGTVFFGNDAHGGCALEGGGTCAVAWPPAIVLIEDCGAPIEPWLLSDGQRWDCYRLLDGLHSAGFVTMQHPGLTAEKMLVQPGPLTVPREARSYATPSFRLVDFGLGHGRATVWERQEGFEERWREWCECDLDGAFDALRLDPEA